MINITIQKRSLFLLILALLFVMPLQAQNTNIRIEGSITNKERKPLFPCSIQLLNTKNQLVSFTNLETGNKYNISIIASPNDSFHLIARFGSYLPVTYLVALAGRTKITQDIIIDTTIKQLENVIIRTGPRWQNGDTTFYRADYYKEPTTHKLEDLLRLMPGFSFDKDGTLRFQGKPTNKILVEGEELFAENQQLLLKNFPADVIKNIQALENQTNNPRLKGLVNDKQVNVNIDLKDEAAHKLFGDIEAGVGSLNRYLLNPVLFEVFKKIKLGYISNINNYGKDPSFIDLYKLKGPLYNEASRIMVQNYINIIPQFNSSRYIKNQLQDHHLQLNIPIGKKIKTQNEVTVLSNRNTQSSIENSRLVLTQGYSLKNSNTNNILKPALVQVSHKFDISFNKNAGLISQIKYGYDMGRNYVMADIVQDNIQYQNNSEIRNKWQSFLMNNNYTWRPNKNTAFTLDLDGAFINMNQYIQSQSASWASLFQLPNAGYKTLVQPFDNKAMLADFRAEYLRKKGSRLQRIMVLGEYKRASMSSVLQFKDSSPQIITYDPLSSKGWYRIINLSVPYSYYFKLLKLPLVMQVTPGISFIKIIEPNNNKEKTRATITSSLKWQPKIKGLSAEASFDYNNQANELYDMQSSIFPSGIASYMYHKTPLVNQPGIRVNARVSKFFKDFRTLIINYSWSQGFNARLFLPGYIGFVQVSSDSVIQNATSNNNMLMAKYSFPIVPLGLKVSLDYSGMYTKSISPLGNHYQYNNLLRHTLDAGFKRSWNKQVYLEYIYSREQSQYLAKSNIPKTITTAHNVTSQIVVKKNSQIVFKLENTRFFVQNRPKKSYLFCDLELNHTLKKNATLLRFGINNIFDIRQFEIVSNSSPLYQFQKYVPLIPRNVFISAKFKI